MSPHLLVVTGPNSVLPAGTVPITGLTVNFASKNELAQGSDNWPTTWADDGHQYAFWGDGAGFGGPDPDSDVLLGAARIEGDHDSYTGINVNGGVDSENPSTLGGKTHQQPIFRAGVLYFWQTPGSGATGFSDSNLWKSSDYGATVTKNIVEFSLAVHGISHMGFVQYGQDHAGPAEDAGYFYLTCIEVQQSSNLLGLQTPANIFLLRVPVGEVETLGSYEWFTGLDDGDPTWGAIGSRAAVHTDASGFGPFVQVQYVTGLARYVMWAEYGGGTSDLVLLEAPEPWGPWTEVDRINAFGNAEIGLAETIFQWQLAPKWERNGGIDFTLIFSGTGENDSWNTVDGSFTVA